ncbi:MAG TPA: gamma-glutamylcyclotransferase [Verrucomicrobiales bacterium]|nr:gamma-glutamylcyclotransferase [Verrucomicrobiales bacterium]HRJ07819.1 gamma-glutamylcyclotransferase [Prosthecobacter sp.]HRK14191.1 gamma-glutamylcyclotransferase [Prosthecobacter sp.]
MLVFVYGTLKRGKSNHAFLDGQKFAGLAVTRAVYRMYDAGGYPGLVYDVENGCPIRGEVWDVDEACLERLDVLENVAGGDYQREKIALEPPFDGLDVQGYRWLLRLTGLRDAGQSW